MPVKYLELITITICLMVVQGQTQPNYHSKPTFPFYERVIKKCFNDAAIMNCYLNPSKMQECRNNLTTIQTNFINNCKDSVKLNQFDKCEETFFNSLKDQQYNKELKNCRKTTQVLVAQDLPTTVYQQIVNNCFNLPNQRNRIDRKLIVYYSVKDQLLKCAGFSPNDRYNCQSTIISDDQNDPFTKDPYQCVSDQAQQYYLNNFPKFDPKTAVMPASLEEALFLTCAHGQLSQECKTFDCQYQFSAIISTIIKYCSDIPILKNLLDCENYAMISNNIEKNSAQYKTLQQCRETVEIKYFEEYNKIFSL